MIIKNKKDVWWKVEALKGSGNIGDRLYLLLKNNI